MCPVVITSNALLLTFCNLHCLCIVSLGTLPLLVPILPAPRDPSRSWNDAQLTAQRAATAGIGSNQPDRRQTRGSHD